MNVNSISARPIFIEWDNNTPNNLQQILQPGDILFYYRNQSNNVEEFFDRAMITGGQLLERAIFPVIYAKNEALHECIHVGVYVGEGKFAEATWGIPGDEDVRIGRFSEESQAMPQGSGRSLRVTRLENQALANEMAKMATYLAEDKSTEQDIKAHKTRNSYSLSLAVQAIFKEFSFGTVTGWEKQTISQALEIAMGIDPLELETGHKKKFFCSHFFVECLQRAELSLNREFIDAIKGKLQINGLNKDNLFNSEINARRAKLIVEIYRENRDFIASLNFRGNSEAMTPAKTRFLVLNKTNQFKDVLEIRAKN